MDTPQLDERSERTDESANRAETDLTLGAGSGGFEPEPDTQAEYMPSVPESVKEAEAGRVTDPGVIEMDATAWFMESDTPTPDEVEPTEITLNVGTSEHPKKIKWYVVPLPDEEFRKFRNSALPRQVRRGGRQTVGVTEMDDGKYHLLVVTAATVSPDLREIARRKGVQDPAEVVKNRLAHKPGLIAQISGVVSDISGYDESDIEVAAGNS